MCLCHRQKNHLLIYFTSLQVDIYVGDIGDYAARDPLVRLYKTPEEFYQATGKSSSLHGPNPDATAFSMMNLLAPFHAMYCDALLKSKESMERISNADLIIGDGLYLCSSLIADRFSLPHVVIVTQTLSIPTMRVFGLPMPPAYVPQFRSSFTDRQTFAQRLKNLYDWLLVYWVVYFRMTPPFQELKAKYEITPQKGLYETLGRVDLIISQKPLILEYPRPLMPCKLVTDVFPCTVTRCLR